MAAHVPYDYSTRLAITTIERLLASGTITKAHARTLLAGVDNEFRQQVSKQVARTPAEEVEERCKALQEASPGLTRDQAQERVFRADPDLYERHVRAMRSGTGNPSANYGPQGPPVDVTPLTKAAVMQMAKAMITKQAGLTLREALAKLVQDYPREAIFLETYRQFHLNEGLDEHHGGTAAAPRMRTAYDIMSSGSHS